MPSPSSSSSSSSPHRKLLHSLIYWAVQRCRMSESPCRLTVSLKSPPDPAASSPLRVSVSDTGVGSKLEEFLELDALARETPVEKWDGTLLITTTGINDKAIYHYQFNLQEETSSSARFSKLATTYKNSATFSGTEVCICLSNEADLDEIILWLTGFVRKDLAIELAVEKTGTTGSRNVCLPHDSDDATPNIERLVSGLKDYALSHGNTCEKCDACCMNRDRLKVGTGSAKIVDRRRDKGLLVEVVIMIAHTVTDLTCWMVNCSSSQVLHFEDFIPCTISQSSFNVLMSMDWQSYGFKLKGGFMDDEGNAVLQWDNLTFARVDIAIHTYHGVVQEWQRSEPDKYLVRKALKSALCRLKEDHAGDFLSCHGKKIREYVPDLAESIAGLISSSNDQEFQDECFTLLGLGSDQDISEGAVRSCISDKMARIIEMNDTKENVVESTPYLFECEKLDEDSEQLDEEDGDEDMVSDY
nr:type 2 DNA topoisomerase 6 subunit B-like isoform X2 [Lolium perenne]